MASESYRKKLSVVTLVDTLGTAGGAERLAVDVVRRLDPGRFDRTLCISRWSPEQGRGSGEPVLEGLRRSDVRFLGLERRSSVSVASWRPLLALLRRERVDILHAHKFGSNVWAAVIGPIARTPVVIAHEHTWSYQGRPVRKLLDRYLIARRVDAFVAVSREDRRRMIEIEGIDPAKIRFIPNGIAMPPSRARQDLREQMGIAEGDPVIGAVGRLRAQKAYEVLVRAAAILRLRFPRLRVLIAGEGEERPGLEALIEELGVAKTVTLLGHHSDVPALLETVDLAVSCSEFEGSPLSVMEYMAAGKPVVATRVGGVPDLIEHGIHGLLVEPRDPDALAAAVSELLEDPGRAASMGERARERRRQEFDIEVTVRRVAALYEELRARSAA